MEDNGWKGKIMDSFLVALNAVVPFLCYILFGYVVRHVGLADEDFFKRLNQLVFKAFFPILMFNNMYQIEPGFVPNGKLVAFSVAALLSLIVILYLIVPRLVPGNPQRSVIIQAIYRSNFVLFAIPLTANIFGDDNTTVAAMLVAIIIPIYNMAAVFVLESFRGGRLRLSVLMKNICTNPLILGSMTGLLFFLLRIHLPLCLEKPIEQFANLTTPLGMFVLGGSLHFSKIQGNAKYLVPSLLLKLVIIPAIILMIISTMDFTSLERFVIFTMFATPVAASSYTMAQNMGGDGELAGEFVVLSTALSVITIFLWVFALKMIRFI